MIYQIDGKIVKEKPEGKFEKVVTVPGKLMNFITKVSKEGLVTKDFFINDGKMHHITEVKETRTVTRYIDGIKATVK